MTPEATCRKICKKSGSNFVYAFYLVGSKKRRALEAFYAFCRVVDDTVDEATSTEKARGGLKFWLGEIEKMVAGRPTHPVGIALSPALKQFEIPSEYLKEIVAGCEMDLDKKSYATFDELELYCYRVASCVGLVCLHIFGVAQNPNIREAGIALGKALQITNILRDIRTDFARGRVYLPQEDLKTFGLHPEDLSNSTQSNLNLIELMYCEMDRAKSFFKTAWNGFPLAGPPRRKILPATLMGRFYETILNKISRDPLIVFRKKVSLSWMEKMDIAAKEICNALL